MQKGTAETREGLLEENRRGGTADATLRRLPSVGPRAEYGDAGETIAAEAESMQQTSDVSKQSLQRDPADKSDTGMPPVRDVLNHANFGLLPEPERDLRSFGVSAGVNLTLAALAILATIVGVHQVQVHKQETLTFLTPPPKAVVPPPPPPVKLPPVPKLLVEPPKIQPPVPRPVVEPPKVHIEVATKAPVMPAPTPRPVVAPPKPVLGAFASAHEPAHQATKVAQVQAAGFGQPTGAHPSQDARASNMPKMGGFGAAQSSDRGADSRLGQVASAGFGSGAPAGSPRGSMRGTVASAGFGSGTRQAGSPGNRGAIASAGFGSQQPAHGSQMARTANVQTTQIVILSKPLPQYTAEARAARVEGDVTLQVRFTADGRVEVLGVVRGLGHGLDEQAEQAASRIRFKPATRDGKAVDQVSTIRISFELA
jgi:TonB family protein